MIEFIEMLSDFLIGISITYFLIILMLLLAGHTVSWMPRNEKKEARPSMRLKA